MLHQNSKIVYAVHRAGYGKTVMNFLAALYIKQNDEHVLYLVKDEYLKAQAIKKAEQLKVSGFDILCYREFKSKVQINSVLICDEYYDALNEARLGVDSDHQPNPIFEVGFDHRALLTTATYQESFFKLLMATFGSVVYFAGDDVPIDEKSEDPLY